MKDQNQIKDNKKSIDIIVKYFYPVAAGIETNVLETHKYFLDKGWRVRVHTSVDTLTQKNVLEKKDLVKGIEVIRYPYSKFGYFPKIDWVKTNVVSLHNFNIFPHSLLMLYVIYLKLLNKKHFVFALTPHGGFNPEWKIFSKLQKAIKYLYHFTIGVLLINGSTDVVRAVSEWEHDQIVKKGVSSKIVYTIINGAEDEAFLDIEKLASDQIKEKVKSYKKYIIQIGRIYMIKNYETTIKALSLLPEDINYLIVGPIGSNEYKLMLENLISELGLQNRVIFSEVVRGVDKYYLIKKAQMMVHMALWESFCNVVYEGMSQGLVCIVANNTALPYLIKNNINGYLVETKDYKGVAEKIRYVLDHKNDDVIQKIKQTNRIFGLKYSWKITSETLQKLYNEKIANLESRD